MIEDSSKPQHVYVEEEWYDGPRAGIANFRGVPHRFLALEDDTEGGLYLLAPIDSATLALEIEQFRIFVAWNDAYEAKAATTESHPGKGGVSTRWDELELLLAPLRPIEPDRAFRARAHFRSIENARRYQNSGPGYAVVWLRATG